MGLCPPSEFVKQLRFGICLYSSGEQHTKENLCWDHRPSSFQTTETDHYQMHTCLDHIHFASFEGTDDAIVPGIKKP
jgi:hypothetical protein